ncbi:MAG: VCBS repeat-containing protein [Deltaproteobacteria bacterium]|nr:VCBS repeat-containing protein [Deltaproteobacteria bacterium]
MMESHYAGKTSRFDLNCFHLIIIFFALCFMPETSRAAMSFDHFTSYEEGSSPAGVLLEDFNKDSIPEMAVTNLFNQSISIRLGSGTGAFQLATHYFSGVYPLMIISEDFNNDDKLDIVTTNDDNTFTLIAGNGDGTFLPGITGGNTGEGPISIATADFNSDEELDIITANKASSTVPVSLYLGNGDGTFTASSFPYHRDMPTSVDTADFNNDGKADLAITYPYAGHIAVFLGNGDGTFNLVSTNLGGYSLYGNGLSVEDINFDGVHDIVTVPSFGKGIVLLGNGDGTFLKVNWNARSTEEYTSMVISDFDCDGKHDMALAGFDFNDLIRRLYIYQGNGDGTFQESINYVTPMINIFVLNESSIDAEDLNGDGKNDIAIKNSMGDRVNIYLNRTSPPSGLCSVIPDIKANASDGPLTINQGDLLNVSLSLDPGTAAGFDADWWVYALSPTSGTYWFKLGSSWIASETPILANQGPLSVITDLTVLEMSGLPAGNYEFYFEVDERNGIKEGARTDGVNVTIQ